MRLAIATRQLGQPLRLQKQQQRPSRINPSVWFVCWFGPSNQPTRTDEEPPHLLVHNYGPSTCKSGRGKSRIGRRCHVNHTVNTEALGTSPPAVQGSRAQLSHSYQVIRLPHIRQLRRLCHRELVILKQSTWPQYPSVINA